MKCARERRFLENLNIASIYFDEFLTFNVLNDIEKKIMYYVFRKRRSIRNVFILQKKSPPFVRWIVS